LLYGFDLPWRLRDMHLDHLVGYQVVEVHITY